jgi:hypothetical protein
LAAISFPVVCFYSLNECGYFASLTVYVESTGEVMAIGDLFSQSKSNQWSKKKGAVIADVVEKFLSARGITDFTVCVIRHEDFPIILIMAAPHRRLRYSNILEAQIVRAVAQGANVEDAFVFWRYQVGDDHSATVEQADFETAPSVVPSVETIRVGQTAAIRGSHSLDRNFGNTDLRSLSHSIQTDDASLSEFDSLLRESGPEVAPSMD